MTSTRPRRSLTGLKQKGNLEMLVEQIRAAAAGGLTLDRPCLEVMLGVSVQTDHKICMFVST